MIENFRVKLTTPRDVIDFLQQQAAYLSEQK